MFYTIYKITNKINGKFYIGKHQTKDLNDGYMGSGKLIIKAISKYGIENFEKNILYVYNNKKDMELKELEIVNENFINSDNSYNLALGGKGGWDIKKAKVAFLGKKHTQESKDKIRNYQIQNNSMKSNEVREKVSKSLKGVKKPSVSLALKGTKKSEEHKRKIAESVKKRHMERIMGSGAIGSANDSES